MTMIRKFWVFVILYGLFFLPCKAHPQQNGQDVNLISGYYKAQPLSMGGAWRSIAEGANAITLNPSGLAFKKANGVSFDYVTSGYLDTRVLSGSVFDSKSIGIAAGISYDRSDMTVFGRGVGVNQFTIAAAKDFSEIMAVGMNFKYISIQREISSGGGINHFTGDMSVTVHPIPQLSTSFELQNIYSGRRYPEIPLLLGLSSALILGDTAKLCVDMETDFSTNNSSRTNYYFGGEVNVTEGIYFRSGFGLDRVRDNPFFGTGLGFFGPKLALNFAFSEKLNPVEQAYAIAVQLAF